MSHYQLKARVKHVQPDGSDTISDFVVAEMRGPCMPQLSTMAQECLVDGVTHADTDRSYFYPAAMIQVVWIERMQAEPTSPPFIKENS